MLATKPYIDSAVNLTCRDDQVYTFVTEGSIRSLNLAQCFKYHSLYPVKYRVSNSDGTSFTGHNGEVFKINDTTGLVQVNTEMKYSGRYLVKVSASD